MSIEIDHEQLEDIERALSGIKNGYNTCVTRALNKAGQSTQAKAAKVAAERYTIKQRDVKADIKMTRATPKDFAAEVKVSGMKAPEFHFSVRPRTNTTGAKRRQLAVEKKRGQVINPAHSFVWDRKVMQRDTTAPRRTMHAGYWAGRKDKQGRPIKREPLVKRYGPASAEMVGAPESMEQIEEHAAERLKKELDHEAEALINGYTK